MDLLETDDHFVLRADLPGMTEDDVKIELEDTTLTVSGERKAEHETGSEGYYRVERAFGSFARTLTLPAGRRPRGRHRRASTAACSRSASRSPRRASRAGSRSAARPPDDRGLRTRRPGRAVAPPRIPTRGDG